MSSDSLIYNEPLPEQEHNNDNEHYRHDSFDDAMMMINNDNILLSIDDEVNDVDDDNNKDRMTTINHEQPKHEVLNRTITQNIENDDYNNNNITTKNNNTDIEGDLILGSPPPALFVDHDTEHDDNNIDNNDDDDDVSLLLWRLSNAVHMEVQENAKISTFHWNVNRTGSSSISTTMKPQKLYRNISNQNQNNQNQSNNNLIDGIDNIDALSLTMDTNLLDDDYLQLNDTISNSNHSHPINISDFNLTEIFLQSEQKQRHNNFPTHKSSRYDTIISSLLPITSTIDDDKNDTDDVVDPTPLSEIKKKLQKKQQTINETNNTTTNSTSSYQNNNQNQQQYLSNSAVSNTTMNITVPYWTRQEPLPIPSPVQVEKEMPIATTTYDNDNSNSKEMEAPTNTPMIQDDVIIPTDAITDKSASVTETISSSKIPASVSFPTLNMATTNDNNTTQQTNSIYNIGKKTTALGTTKSIIISNASVQEQQHSKVQSITRPAVQKASEKYNQYGFGRNHVVPSVPTMTVMKHSNSMDVTVSNNNNTKKTTKRSYSRSSSTRSQVSTTKSISSDIPMNQYNNNNNNNVTSQLSRAPSTTSQDDDDSGSGGGGMSSSQHNNNNASGISGSNMAGNIAYERKKERAKTARIRLNESIDRLQIALHMAGTQSKQRLSMFEEHTIPYRIITDCMKCAEDAKKWDRPSFVGSTATMIQGLNAQCEALVRALHDERHARAEHTINATTATSGNASSTTGIVSKTTTNTSSSSSPKSIGDKKGSPCQKHGCNNNDNTLSLDTDTVVKRQKLNGDSISQDHSFGVIMKQQDPNSPGIIFDSDNNIGSTGYVSLCGEVFTDSTITDRIANFLDPVSLIRCMRVSHAWMNGNSFNNDTIWERLAVNRFGFYNVRQWLTKMEDFAHREVYSSIHLYKTMDVANIMPHCRLDGMLLLGESRLLGKVSAWTYLVERSNGETMRSVQRQANMPGTGMYTSLPVVQLRTIIQNTGIHDDVVVIREQSITVDASTRRRGDEMLEIDWDERFTKRILNMDGTTYVPNVLSSNGRMSQSIYRELCRLRLFDSIILETNIHARGCATTSKFVQKSNFTKILIQIRDGTTVPLVIPFPRDASHLLP